MFRKLFLLLLLTAQLIAAPSYIPENHTVTIAWDYDPTVPISGYKLYSNGYPFAPFGDGTYIRMTTTGVLDTYQLTTAVLPAGVYNFTLTAVGLDGTESDQSDALRIEALPKPKAPQALRVKP